MKWGILATGTIAKKFASTVEQMGAEGEQLVAVGSRHLESAQAFAQQYGIPRCYDSYEALAADPEVEAIYIATPNTLHYENCKLCLELLPVVDACRSLFLRAESFLWGKSVVY